MAQVDLPHRFQTHYELHPQPQHSTKLSFEQVLLENISNSCVVYLLRKVISSVEVARRFLGTCGPIAGK
jgi:hypothetical protein